MNESPNILIVSDEPMLLVDLLHELEGRGFTTFPRTRGDYALCSNQQDVDVAVFDIRHPDNRDMKFVSALHHSGIPIVMFGGGSSTIPARISHSATCVVKPVDYDQLAETLLRLSSHMCMGNALPRGGAIPLSQSIPADKP